MNIKEKYFDDIKVGDKASFERVVTVDDLAKFSQISGDYNPLHVDENYASETQFKNRIVHGMFMGALVSCLIGMELPGKYALLMKECLEFKKPAFIGDKLKVLGRVIHKSQTSRLLEIGVEISKNHKILVSGSVYVKVLQ